MEKWVVVKRDFDFHFILNFYLLFFKKMNMHFILLLIKINKHKNYHNYQNYHNI